MGWGGLKAGTATIAALNPAKGFTLTAHTRHSLLLFWSDLKHCLSNQALLISENWTHGHMDYSKARALTEHIAASCAKQDRVDFVRLRHRP